MKKRYHLIDHTADFGIQVFGSDSQELFINAALALFDVITEMDVLKGRDSCNITACKYYLCLKAILLPKSILMLMIRIAILSKPK